MQVGLVMERRGLKARGVAGLQRPAHLWQVFRSGHDPASLRDAGTFLGVITIRLRLLSGSQDSCVYLACAGVHGAAVPACGATSYVWFPRIWSSGGSVSR